MSNIPTITNGMDMGDVRDILNQVIEKLNGINVSPTDYEDLENKPAIDGIPLTKDSSISDFNITIEDTSIVSSLEELARNTANENAEETAMNTIEAALRSKLNNNFSALPVRQYEFSKNTLVPIQHNGTNYHASMKDIATYLEYLVHTNRCCSSTPISSEPFAYVFKEAIINDGTLHWDATGNSSISLYDEYSQNLYVNLNVDGECMPHKLLIRNPSNTTMTIHLNNIGCERMVGNRTIQLPGGKSILFTVVVIPYYEERMAIVTNETNLNND